RAFEVFGHLHGHHFEGLCINQVGFRQHGYAALHGQQPADVEVFTSLRLDGFVGCDYEEHQIDAADSCQHVAHEAFVAGNVHETNADRLSRRPREIEVGKADV